MNQSDEELLAAVAAGDREAFGVLYGRRRSDVYRFALHMTGNASVAEDITQDVFMTLIQGTFAFDESRGALSAYLFGIGRKLGRPSARVPGAATLSVARRPNECGVWPHP